jgi:hypothetical protein
MDIQMDDLPQLFIPRRMLGRWLVRWALPPFGLLADALPPLLLASSLADALLPRVTWPFPRYGCFVIVGVFASSTADAWLLVGSLADALPPFCSLADALQPLLLDGLLCRRPLRYCILFLTSSVRWF